MGFSVADATKAWCIRWKRGEFRLDFPGRVVFPLAPEGSETLFFFLGFALGDDAWVEGVVSAACP